jgi:hypothetical protein
MANVLDVELEGIEGKEEKLDRILEQIVVAIEEAGTKKEE